MGQQMSSSVNRRYEQQAKDAVRLEPKRFVVRSGGSRFPRRRWRTTGEELRPSPPSVHRRNVVSPSSSHWGTVSRKSDLWDGG
jgi:hypothetical protein